MDEMTSRERFFAVLKGEQPDRVPVDVGFFLSAIHCTGITAVDFYHSGKLSAEALIAAHERFGFDALHMGINGAVYSELFGGECIYLEYQHPMVKGPIIKDRSDIDGLELPELDKTRSKTFHNAVDTIKRLKDKIGDKIAIGGLCNGSFNLSGVLRGMEQLMVDAATDLELFLKIAQFSCDTLKKVGKAYIDAGVDYIWTPDASSSPACLSPKFYEKYVVPIHSQFFSEMKRLGAYTIYHPCGNEYPILCHVRKIKGLDAYNFSNLVDLKIVRQIYGADAILWGNVNPAEVLLIGTPEMVEADVKRIIEGAGVLGGLVMAAGCSIPPNVPQANLKAFFDATKKYGKYPMI